MFLSVLIALFSQINMGFCQTSSPYNGLDYYDVATRVLEIRTVNNHSKSSTIEIESKQYKFFQSKEDALSYFKHPNDAYYDYLVVYIPGENNVEAEIFQITRKALKHKYEHLEDLEEEIWEIDKLK